MKLTTHPFKKLQTMQQVHQNKKVVYDLYKLLCQKSLYVVTNGTKEQIETLLPMLRKKQFHKIMKSPVRSICLQAVTFLFISLFKQTLLKHLATTKGMALLFYRSLEGTFYIASKQTSVHYPSLCLTFLSHYIKDHRFDQLLAVCMKYSSKQLDKIIKEFVCSHFEQEWLIKYPHSTLIRFQEEWVIATKHSFSEVKKMNAWIQFFFSSDSICQIYCKKPPFLRVKLHVHSKKFLLTNEWIDSIVKKYDYGTIQPFFPKARPYLLNMSEEMILTRFQTEHDDIKKEISYVTPVLPKGLEAIWYYSLLKTIAQKRKTTVFVLKQTWTKKAVIPHRRCFY